MKKFKPVLENLEKIELLSTTVHHPIHNPIHHPVSHVSQNHKNHVSPHTDVALPTKITGSLSDSLTPPALANAPYTVFYTGPIIINGISYNSASVEGTISTQTYTGTLTVATSDGNLTLSVITLNDMTAGNYKITGGTGNFVNSVGTGVLFFSGSNTSFNPHEYRPSFASGTLIQGQVNVDSPSSSDWTFSGSANIRIGGNIYPSTIAGSIKDQVGNITITTSSGTIEMNVMTIYDVTGGNYTITSGSGDFQGITGRGIILIRNNYISFNAHEYH
jgi:hypothetical protein